MSGIESSITQAQGFSSTGAVHLDLARRFARRRRLAVAGAGKRRPSRSTAKVSKERLVLFMRCFSG